MKYDKLNIKKEELKVRDKNTIISGARVECLGNRPFFSCVVSCQAFDWEWGGRRPCCDRDQYLVSMLTK